MGCHFLLQAIFLTQGLNPHLRCLLHWQADSFTTDSLGKPSIPNAELKIHRLKLEWVWHSSFPDSRLKDPEGNTSLESPNHYRKANSWIWDIRSSPIFWIYERKPEILRPVIVPMTMWPLKGWKEIGPKVPHHAILYSLPTPSFIINSKLCYFQIFSFNIKIHYQNVDRKVAKETCPSHSVHLCLGFRDLGNGTACSLQEGDLSNDSATSVYVQFLASFGSM